MDSSKNLINELKKGRELAKQLQVHLNVPSSPHESRELLVHKILCSYDKALSMLKNASTGNNAVPADPQLVGRSTESPRSFSTGSPLSEDSDREFKDPDQKDASRKRKSAMHRWSKQVEISPGGGLEGPLDDGYSWRKYGQKDILGAKFPRGYYRCSHRTAYGCLATKQVQRNDNNPIIFEITYRGEHTCTQGRHQSPPPEKQKLTSQPPPGNQETIVQPPPEHHQQTPDMLLNFQTDLQVITENLNTSHELVPPQLQYSFPSFHFGGSATTDNIFPANNTATSFVSPATSGSNYFSVLPTSNFNASSDCELSEVVSAATLAAANATTVGVGLGFPFEFDHNFTFDNPNFF